MGDEMLQDMAPLFENVDLIQAGDAAMMQVVGQLIQSEELATEPEFLRVFFPPNECAEAFWEWIEMQNPDYDPSQEDEIAEEMAEKVIERIARLFYHHPAREDIMANLDALRRRLRRTGRRDTAAKAAGLLYFLDTDLGEQIWPSVGLIQALVRRSVAAGLRLSAVASSLADTMGFGKSSSSEAEEAQRASLEESLTLLREIPGLETFLSQEADKVWMEGLSALTNGEVFLGLYTAPEIIGALDILHASHKASLQQRETQGARQEREHEFADRLAGYVAELLTAERLEQMRSRLGEARGEAESDPPAVAFIDLLLERLSAEGAAQRQRPLLTLALLGEVQASVAAYREMKAAEKGPSGDETSAHAPDSQAAGDP
jgi:hypothetical protein